MKLLRRLRRRLLIHRMAHWLARLDTVDFYLELSEYFPVPEPAVRGLIDVRAEFLEKFSRNGQLARALDRQGLPLALNRQLEPTRAPWPRGRFPHRWWECGRMRQGWIERLDRQVARARAEALDPESSR